MYPCSFGLPFRSFFILFFCRPFSAVPFLPSPFAARIERRRKRSGFCLVSKYSKKQLPARLLRINKRVLERIITLGPAIRSGLHFKRHKASGLSRKTRQPALLYHSEGLFPAPAGCFFFFRRQSSGGEAAGSPPFAPQAIPAAHKPLPCQTLLSGIRLRRPAAPCKKRKMPKASCPHKRRTGGHTNIAARPFYKRTDFATPGFSGKKEE